MNEGNFDTLLNSIGVTGEGVSGMLGDLDDEVVSGLPFEEEDVGKLILKHAPGALTSEQTQRLAHNIHKRTSGIERVYASATAAYMLEQNMRPNNSITLYATSVTALCTAGVQYSLKPRIGGAIQTDSFEMTPQMSFMRIMSDPIDCMNKFSFVGGSIGFVDDAAKIMSKDTQLTGFRPEVRTADTPLGSLQKRTPQSTTKFTASVYFDGAAASTQIFYGVKLMYTDSSCMNSSKWISNIQDLDYGGVARGLMARARSRFGRARQKLTF